MCRFRIVLAGVLGLFALDAVAAGLPADPAPQLISHQALYAIGLREGKPQSGLARVRGAMMYRFSRACDGWVSENRSVMRFLAEDERGTENTWSFASWESFDGRRFRFRVREAQDGQPADKIQGEAHSEKAGREAEVRYTEPAGERLVLKAGTMFPTAHLIEVLELARAGGMQLNRYVFDGSTVEHAYEVNVLITPVPEAAAAAIARETALPPLPAWWVRMAFFPPQAEHGLPEFEVGIRYREDGVADRVIQDFGDFSLELRMTNLDRLPLPEC